MRTFRHINPKCPDNTIAVVHSIKKQLRQRYQYNTLRWLCLEFHKHISFFYMWVFKHIRTLPVGGTVKTFALRHASDKAYW